jgi:uncharacterized protein YndB with AHSA1/START domain
MALREEIVLTHSIEIEATPEKVFDFLTHLIDDESYRAWHPDDHIALRWIKGQPWKEGSVLYAEEYLHGKLHKLKGIVTEVIPNRRIEFAPLPRFLRIFFPKSAFIIEPKGDGCVFTTTGCLRVGWLVRTFAKRQLELGIASAEKHMKEEGENLKRIVESQVSPHDNSADGG